MAHFYQAPPEVKSDYTHYLRELVLQLLPKDLQTNFDSELQRFSECCVNEIYLLQIEALKNLPRHVPFSPWGERIDEIEVSEAWQKLHRVSAEEGLVAIAYERKWGEYSRLLQMLKIFLFHPNSAFYSCPLAMTDGAARILELKGQTAFHREIYQHLVTRDVQKFWTSGQWMTEREGGSDVSNSATQARHVKDDIYELTGDKWFSSATTSDIAFTLAKIDDAKELSLFCLKVRNANGALNGITVHRLKDKFGTKALPTAELSLNATVADLIGEKGAGVKNIATMLNITRMYNTVSSLGQMSRSIQLATDFAKKRKAFGQLIINHPLHKQTLGEMNLHLIYGLHFVTKLAVLMGREECGVATDDEKEILRLLIPIAKLTTAKHAVAIASECVESFGGGGYVEDTGVPLMLRDAQVFSIWEGTTNILSLDVLRVMQKSPRALAIVLSDIEKRILKAEAKQASDNITNFKKLFSEFKALVDQMLNQSREQLNIEAKYLAFSIGYFYAASLMLDFNNAFSPKAQQTAESAFEMWIKKIAQLKLQYRTKPEVISHLVL